MIDGNALADALSWTGGTAEVDRLDAALVAASREALSQVSDDAARAVEALAPPARDRVLRAPEVTRRLLFPGPERPGHEGHGRPGEAGGTTAVVTAAAAVEAALDACLTRLLPPPERTCITGRPRRSVIT